MKKTLLMMAAALTAWSASAQLYVTGDNVEGQPAAWDPANTLVVTSENGEYSFEATGGFKISIAQGTWDDFNGAAYQLAGAWDKGTTTATSTLRQGDGNITTPMSNVKIKYTVKDDMSAITATLPAGYSFGEAPAPDFYLIGNFNNWTLADAACKMTPNGNVYTITVADGITVAAGEGWKINNGSWDLDFGQGEEGMPVAGTLYNLASGGADMTTSVAAGSTITFTYNEGGVSTLLISSNGGGGDTPVDTPAQLYVVGSLATSMWEPATAVLMNKDGNVFTATDIELVGEANFNFLTAQSWDEPRYGGLVDNEDVTFDGDVAMVTIVPGANAIKALPGKYNMTLTFAAGGNTLKLEKAGEIAVVEDLVLTGSFNEWAMNDAAYKMTKDGDIYTITIPSIEADTQFKVKTAEDNWNTSWGAEGPEGDESAPAVAVTLNTPMNAWTGSFNNFLVAETITNATITFVRSNDASVASVLTISGTSAIEAVEAVAAEAPAQYFNLQGIRVLAPQAGQLYIVNRAGKVSKEIAR